MGKDDPHRVDEVCPFSDPPYTGFTDDHVFPQFLGGRRSIRVCADCNSRFGHSFEAGAAKQLRRLQVFISHFGLDLSRSPATWPSALVIGDATYSLKSGPQGVQYELAQPIIRRDEWGNIVGGSARSHGEAKRIGASLVRKGKAKKVEVEESPPTTFEDVKLTVGLGYDDDIFRFSAKLTSNAVVAMGRGPLVKASSIGRYLRGSGEWGTCIAFCDTSAIRLLRPPLSHTIYVEFGVQSYAIVVVFGYFQVYVPLPGSESGAAIGFLDPLTGEESFGDAAPIGIAPPAKFVSRQQIALHLQYINRQLTDEANARGALHPPNLQMSEFDPGLPSLSPSWTDGTHRFYRKP
ncbi:MAG: HNH endonuclease [Candidatus Sulfotelmatobacter sp.]